MLKHGASKLIVQNVSNYKVSFGNHGFISPGKIVDAFKLSPNVTEMTIIEGLRSPNGFLYREVFEKKSLKIHDYNLVLLDNISVDRSKLETVNEGKPGQVLTISDDEEEEKDLVWVDKHEIEDVVAAVDRSVKVAAPLTKKNGEISLPQATENSSGYLSKDDWVFFKGKANGIRVWQYQDFDRILQPKVKLTAFENGDTKTLFNDGLIVNESAVIVDQNTNDAPLVSDSFFAKFKKDNRAHVAQHLGDVVLLDSVPTITSKCRVYYLVVLPKEIEIPRDYAPPPKYVKQARIALIDSVDVGASTVNVIHGTKEFRNRVSITDRLAIGHDEAETELDVEGKIKTMELQLTTAPVNGYVLTSDTIGNAEWGPSTVVSSGPPQNFFYGQMWVKTPEYELFVYDGTRRKWLSVSTFSVVGAKNGTHCTNVYLDTFDNIPMHFNTAVLPWDATLVSMTASCEAESNWSAELHINDQLVPGSVLNVVSNDRALNANFDVDLKEGDRIQFFLSGAGISMPRMEAVFKRRA